jgi:hypothetical protein
MPAGVSAYVPLANVTLGSSATTVTFSSISQAYKDLVLVANATCASGTMIMGVQFNSDTASNYSRVYMSGNGSVTDSAVATEGQIYFDPSGYGATTAGNFYMGIMNIMDYSATDKHKSVIARASIPTSSVAATAGRWANTAAITTVVVRAGVQNFTTGSTFALYGVSA